ncbi:MAG TPA: primosomal protein N' [Candidatus Saccharimonadales bacterium]|nr:primosomal protein N' [Candidatus Saccharimonadales bacterium]
MYYFEVWVTSHLYHGYEALSYSYDKVLESGSLVIVPMRQKNTLAVVLTKTLKPTFNTKQILEILPYRLPQPNLDLMAWLSEYYPAPLGTIASLFVPSSLSRKHKVRDVHEAIKIARSNLPPLTLEQKAVLKQINDKPSNSFLLHGETGTGKTRVYLEMAKQTTKSGKSVLMLTPEISLTPQLVRDFEQVFGQQVITVHSNLSDVERRDAWLKVLLSKKPVVVIGPRSALFAPFARLGLIVIDESHESAYKQEQAPYYQTLRVAGKLSQLYGAQLIMGTATPNVVDYYVAEAKGLEILRMSEPATKIVNAKPVVEVVNSRDRTLFSQSLYLSNSLLQAIKTALDNKEQSLIFLNRRGTARLVMCQICGWQALCPNCDLPLTYHGDSHSMRCHTCGHRVEAVTRCPVCKSADIIYKSIGTKSIVELIKHAFPKARIGRYDSDNTKAERFDQNYHEVSQGNIDILVGTQLLAKGLDLPRLSVVGIVTADTGLTFPDYTAEERTYQQLAQIIGRVGRGHIAGRAIIQTYNPDSPIIGAAINKDWQAFYKSQLEERRQFGFPPFCYLLKLSCIRKTPASASKSSDKLRQDLLSLTLPIQIIGPAPSFYEKTKSGYRWQLIIKSKSRQPLLRVVKSLPANWSYDLDPSSLL